MGLFQKEAGFYNSEARFGGFILPFILGDKENAGAMRDVLDWWTCLQNNRMTAIYEVEIFAFQSF